MKASISCLYWNKFRSNNTESCIKDVKSCRIAVMKFTQRKLSVFLLTYSHFRKKYLKIITAFIFNSDLVLNSWKLSASTLHGFLLYWHHSVVPSRLLSNVHVTCSSLVICRQLQCLNKHNTVLLTVNQRQYTWRNFFDL